MIVRIAEPHGLCSGVKRALNMAEEALATGEPLWCYHEIVHNAYVVQSLQQRGATFIQSLAEVPMGGRVLFSAHGVSPAVRKEAVARKLQVIDATCPFVAKVHDEARNFAKQGLPIALVGHKGHDEVVGTQGEVPTGLTVVETAADTQDFTGGKVALLSQTTVSEAMVRARVAELEAQGCELIYPVHHDICYATRERQAAVAQLATEVDCILVIGSETSSNSKRLVEVAQTAGVPAYLISSEKQLNQIDFRGAQIIGVTSGASTPENLLQAICQALEQFA